MAKNILVINPFGIGDVLFSTPLVSAIKKNYSGCNIAYICNIRTREILETNPDISEVFVFERDEYRAVWRESRRRCIKKIYNFWRDVRKRRFDILFDLSLGKEYAFFCWLIGIKDRRGFNYKKRGAFLTRKIPFAGFNDKPIADYYLELMDAGVKSAMVLNPTNEEKISIESFLEKEGVKGEDALIGIAPGGGAAFGKDKAHYKRWPWERFAEVAARLVKCGAKPIVLWGPGEEDLTESIKKRTSYHLLVSPRTTVRKMAALMQKCKAVICNDGGMLHIAVSQDTPTVSIFGPTDEKVYGPYPPSVRHIILKSTSSSCRPCYKSFKLPECDTKKCLEDITVEDVFNAVCKLQPMPEIEA